MRGQVFIVTQGRENVKLGLVTVELLSEEAVVRHIAKREERLRREDAVREERLRREDAVREERLRREDAEREERTKAEQTTIQPEIDRAVEALSEAEAHAAPLQAIAAKAERETKQAFGLMDNPHHSEMDSLKAWLALKEGNAGQGDFDLAEAAVQRCAARLRALRARQENLARVVRALSEAPDRVPCDGPHRAPRAAAFYFEGLPQAVAGAQTDADGEFMMRVPSRGAFVLAARAERRVLDATEEYGWLIRLAVSRVVLKKEVA